MNTATQTLNKAKAAIKSSHHHLLLAGLLAVGIVASVSVFASGPREILVTSPGVNATVSKDFELKARVTAQQDRPQANVMLTIDQGTATQFIAAAYTGEFKKGVAKDVYFSAGKNMDQSNERLYNIDLLPPGKHTVTAVIRDGSKPGEGTVISSADISFTVKNDKAIATTGEKVTIKPNKPGESPITTRGDTRIKDRQQTLRQPVTVGKTKHSKKTSSIEQAGTDLLGLFSQTAHAATTSGTIHVTSYIDGTPDNGTNNKDRRIGNVNISAEQLENPSNKCGDSNHTSTKLPNGHYVIGGKTDASSGSNHGEISFRDCPRGTYRVTAEIPGGYTLAGIDGGNIAGGANISAQARTVTFDLRAGVDQGPNFYFSENVVMGPVSGTADAPAQTQSQQITPSQPAAAPSQTVGAQACTPTPATRVPIYRWQYTAGADPSYDNMYSQDPNNSPGNGWVRVADEPVFYLYPTQQAGTLPFRQFVNGFHHFYAFTDNLSAGTFEGIIGYGIPASGTQVSDDVALYHSWANNISPYTGEVGAHYYTIDYNRYVDSFNRGYENFSVGPFADTGTAGFVWNTDGSGQVCVPDDTAPQVAITSVSGTSMTVDAQAGIVGGVNGTLASLTVSVDGTVVYSGTPGTGSISGYSIPFPVSLDDGVNHSIVTTVTNNGNLSSNASVTYNVASNNYPLNVRAADASASNAPLEGVIVNVRVGTSFATSGATDGGGGVSLWAPKSATAVEVTVPQGYRYEGQSGAPVEAGGIVSFSLPAYTPGYVGDFEVAFVNVSASPSPAPTIAPTVQPSSTPNPNGGGTNTNYNGVPQNNGAGRAVTTFKDLPATGQASLFTIATILLFAALYYGSSYIARRRRKS